MRPKYQGHAVTKVVRVRHMSLEFRPEYLLPKIFTCVWRINRKTAGAVRRSNIPWFTQIAMMSVLIGGATWKSPV